MGAGGVRGPGAGHRGGPAQVCPAVSGKPGGQVGGGGVNGVRPRLRLRCWSVGRRWGGPRCLSFDVAGPMAHAVGSDRLHPVVVSPRRRHRIVFVAGHGTGVALDDVEDLRCVHVRVAAQDGVVGDRRSVEAVQARVTESCTAKAWRLVGVGLEPVASPVGVASCPWACTVGPMNGSSGSVAGRREAIMPHPRPAMAKSRGAVPDCRASRSPARPAPRRQGPSFRPPSRLDGRIIPFQGRYSHPASPDGAPGNAAAPLRRFRFHHGVPRNTESERAYQGQLPGPERPAGANLGGRPHSTVSSITFFTLRGASRDFQVETPTHPISDDTLPHEVTHITILMVTYFVCFTLK